MKIVIGDKSQISNYFTNDYIKVSSREIPDYIFNTSYDEVHLPFGLNIKGLSSGEYIDVNYNYTLDLINFFLKKSQRVVVYSTCELWSGYNGPIDINTPLNFDNNPYIYSKWMLDDKIKSMGSKKIITVYPFNFNSTYRSEHFLFGKIYKSIIKKEKIEIGFTHYYRDLLHAKYVANVCMNLKENIVIGSGRMFFVNDYIKDLYNHFELDYNHYVRESFDKYNFLKRNEYYLNGPINYSYKDLLADTIQDIKLYIDK
jgi:nucleoside-diphosphate-sugar epimerase